MATENTEKRKWIFETHSNPAKPVVIQIIEIRPAKFDSTTTRGNDRQRRAVLIEKVVTEISIPLQIWHLGTTSRSIENIRGATCVSDCHFRIWKQRVTWYASDIWSEWYPDKKTNDKKTKTIPHICHGHKDGVRGEKICHVEKFQISVHETCGES